MLLTGFSTQVLVLVFSSQILLVVNLDHDELLLLGFPVGPVLPKAEVNLKGWRVWSFTLLEQDESCGQTFMSAQVLGTRVALM